MRGNLSNKPCDGAYQKNPSEVLLDYPPGILGANPRHMAEHESLLRCGIAIESVFIDPLNDRSAPKEGEYHKEQVVADILPARIAAV